MEIEKNKNDLNQSRQVMHYVLAVCLISLIPIWMKWVAPIITRMPSTFSYHAEVLSIDNLYDSDEKKFQGPQISKTAFNIQTFWMFKNTSSIRLTFDVHSISGKQIFSAERYYFINPLNGQHLKGVGDKDREGYLFGPHYASRAGFDYWHVNYDTPAHMKYVGKEKIYGLTVYHYQSKFRVDQSENLSYLSGVPDKFAIKSDVVLDIWIEPVSGWLVKYQDNTQANYYDAKTGALVEPWNKFSNHYTESSILEQVDNATKLKWKALFADFGMPLLLLLIAVILFLPSHHKINYIIKPVRVGVSKIKKPILAYEIIAVIILGVAVTGYYTFWEKRSATLHKIGISIWSDNAEFREGVKGFKDGLKDAGFIEGKQVEYLVKDPGSDIQNQINIIQSFMDNKVELIFTLTTPGTYVAKGITSKIPIVFSNVTYPEEANLIDSVNSSKNNLVGTRNYVLPAIQFYIFNKIVPNIKSIGFVHQKGDPNSEIQFEEFKDILTKRGINIIDIGAVDADNLRQKLENEKTHYDALFLACDTLLTLHGGEVATAFAKNNKIPTLSCSKTNVLQGALAGYVADLYTIGKLAGKKAALILNGAEPTWLYTESPEVGYLIINLETAKLLNITVSPEIIKQADYIVK